MIGPFFYIDDVLYAVLIPREEAEKYGESLTTSISHADFWEQDLARKYPDYEYQNVPRGRVVYTKGIYCVYIDQCIDTPEVVSKVKKQYNLLKEKAHIKVERDNHYQCATCIVWAW